jgi:DNA polymerase I-like protein with 3'-5' exonuclease and polymerase domains
MSDMMFSAAEVAAISGGRRPPPPKDYRLPDQFPSLARAKRISLDLESFDESLSNKTGPGWRRDAYIVGFGLGIGDKKGNIEFSEYYPLRHKSAPNLDAERVYNWLSDELVFYRGEIVGANLLYDFDGFQYQKIQAPLAKFRDVQWSEALLDENALAYKLNVLAKKYLGLSKVTDELKQLYGDGYIKRFHEVHPGHARTYGIGDITLPLQVLFEQEKLLRKEKLDDLFDLECRLLPMLLYMRQLGVRVDLEQARRMNFDLIKARDESIAGVGRLSGVGIDYENFGKPTVMKNVFDKMGIRYPYLTKGDDGKEKIVYAGDPDYENARLIGKPSFRKTWLENGLEKVNPELSELIIRANIAEKARGTFVEGYITDNAIGDRVHCEFHPLRKKKEENEKSQGTITGRFSSSNPNLQNIPSRDEWIGPMCRKMFIPDEDCDFFSADYSQIEYRLLVHFGVLHHCTGAEVPQQMYLTNPKTDFHDACTQLMYKKEWEAAEAEFIAGRITKEKLKKIHKELRKPAKNLNFGMVYGMGIPHLAELIGEIDAHGQPTERALKIMEEYHASSPYIRELSKLYIKQANEHQFVSTILGRRGRFNLWEPRFREKGAPFETALPYEEAVAKWGPKLKVVGTHKAMNKVIQGSAADMLKAAMVQIWESGVLDEGVRLELTVHDELDGSVERTDRARKALAEMVHIMETAIPLHIPVVVSCETGPNWSETH